MTYQPMRLSQFQPSTATSELDCVPAVAAQLINRATVDALRPTHTDIRRASGVTGRGLYYSEAADAALTVSKGKVILEPRFGLSRGAMRDIVASGRATGLSIDTSVTRYTSRRTNTFVGGHTVYVQAYRWTAQGQCGCEKNQQTSHGEFLIDDPGTTLAGFLWWSADLAYRAAEKRGGGHINLLVGPDTEGVAWLGAAKGRFRALPDVDAKDLGPITVGHEYKGGRTEKGSGWQRADGSTGYGWIHVLVNGKWCWANGRRLKRA